MIDHYTPPPGFQFDDRVSPPIVENLYSDEYNVPGKVLDIIFWAKCFLRVFRILKHLKDVVRRVVETAKRYQKAFKTNHIMWMMGDDNAYADAHRWWDFSWNFCNKYFHRYKNMDKLINVVNQNSTNRIFMFYSSPDCYTSAKHQADLTWTTNSYDYLPLRSEG